MRRNIFALLSSALIGIATIGLSDNAFAKRTSFAETMQGMYQNAVFKNANLKNFRDPKFPFVLFARTSGAKQLLKIPAIKNDWVEYKQAAGKSPRLVNLVAPQGARLTATQLKVIGDTVAIFSKHNDAHNGPALSVIRKSTGKVIFSMSVGEEAGFSWSKGAATEGFTR